MASVAGEEDKADHAYGYDAVGGGGCLGFFGLCRWMGGELTRGR